MSNQKANLEKHIEKIASSIDISGKESIAEETSREFPGWSWKCDIKGKYISCSDEVFDCLGIVPNAFINKSLFSFRLTKESANELKRFLEESKTGGNLVVRFEHSTGKILVVNLNISPQVNTNNEMIGWTGFNQVIQEEEGAEAAPEPKEISPEAKTTPISPLSLPATEPIPYYRGQSSEEQFALSDYFMVLIRRRWVVIMTFFFTVLIVASILSQMPNQYTAKAIVRVSSPRSGSAEYIAYDVELGTRLLGTYVELANGEVVKQELGQFVDRIPKIKAQQVKDSELFEITAEDADPGLAQFAANKVAELIIRDGQGRINSEAPVSVYVAEPATLPTKPSSTSPWLIIGLAIVVGLLGGAGLAFVFENMDTRIYSDKQIENLTKIPVIGNIPDDSKAAHRTGYIFEKRIHAESFQRIRTNIFTANGKRPLKTILVTSPVPLDGKSSVIANFAINMAKGNRSVCVVDANLRYPSIHKFFKLENKEGLSDVLVNKVSLNKVILPTEYSNLKVITCGQSLNSPVDILDSENMQKVLTRLSSEFDLVLIDSPASTSVTDPAILSSVVDGVLVVVRHGWVRQEALTRAIKYLKNVEANIIGIISNKTDQGVRQRILQVTSRK
ncbi:MAG: polysaccharide biosynthesis tyrosine autokinase [Leptolinea sp.]|jgi:receptor protein-tyrosine kinase|nr:polysaccharide biosynthesis tyrosine autokinase [Leptolinea sp.]